MAKFDRVAHGVVVVVAIGLIVYAIAGLFLVLGV